MRTSETPVRATRSASRRSISTARRQPWEALVSSSDRAPAARSESRPLAERRAAGPPFEHGLGRGRRDDEVGLDERPVDAERDVAGDAEVGHVLGLRVVHQHAALEAPPELGRDEQPDLARGRAPEEAAGDEDRHPLDAEALELVADRGDHLVSRADLGRRDRQRRLLDHDRRRAAAGHQLCERPAGEWIRERFPHRRADILDVVARPRRAQDDVVRPGLGDDDPGVRQQRDACHMVARLMLRDERPRQRRRAR